MSHNYAVSIGKASEISGLSKKQIRYLTDKGFIKDKRICKGDRYFREFYLEDRQLLVSIKNYLNEGYTLKVAIRKAKSEN